MISIGNLQINKLCLGDVEVTRAYLGDVQVYGSTPEPIGKYMTMTVLDGDTGTTIAPKITGGLPNDVNLQYRINSNGSWNDYVFRQTGYIHLVAGDWVQFRGNNPNGISNYSSNYLNFAISGNPVALSGNIMSLIDGVGDALVIPCDFCFCNMFSKSNVKTVSQDFLPSVELKNSCYADLFKESLLENCPELPAITMKDYCYSGMFYGCTSLTQAPELPATELAYCCYTGMFEKCNSLTTAPELPSMTLKEKCYHYMFYGCSSLNQAPALPATTLAPYCYSSIFQGCTSLTTAPALPATTLAPYCYSSIFQGCTSLTTAPELHATTLAERCYESMFYGCTSLVNAPALPDTTLADWCCAFMFYGCTSLTQAPELPATELANCCYNQMFNGCTSLTQAPELPATTLVEYCYQYMFYGCSKLSYIKSFAKDITAPKALNQWLSGVASTGTFVKPSGVTYPSGTSGIPSGWTVEEYVPKYMTMTVDGSAGSTTIAPTIKGSLPTLNLQYRINNGDWMDFIVGTTADIIVGAGDVVQWKGLNKDGLSIDTKNYLNFSISNPVHMSGNVMSLIDGKGDELVIPNNYCFYKLFSTSKLNTVSSDFLPATGLTSYCYQFMFERCSNLTQSPELPATTLAPFCYNRMFLGCSSLNQSPALPATTLAQNCYENMFENCSSLTQAPELNSTNLAHSCYSFMFNGCSSLLQAPALPATTIEPYCYYYMFGGCSKLTQAPVLNATTLKTYCYAYMFNGCSKLNYVKSLAVNGFNNYGVISSWLSGVSSTGTFVKPAGVTYETGTSGIPSGWTIQNI